MLPQTDEAVKALLSGLDRRPSRYAHLRGNAIWDEFHYSSTEKLQESEKQQTETTTASEADVTAEEMQQALHSMQASGSAPRLEQPEPKAT